MSQFPILPDVNSRGPSQPRPLDYATPKPPPYHPRWWEYLRDLVLFLCILAALVAGLLMWHKYRYG